MGVFFMSTQGLLDYLYWGNPFASIIAYAQYNSVAENIASYPNGPWHRYIGTMAGLFLAFPFLLLAAGYFKTATQLHNRKVLFFASLLFFVFHSYYANKQERFIMPFLPFFIILGTIGFRDLYEQYYDKKWLRGFTKFATIWFLILNTILLCLLSVTYTKRSRVESMNYLRRKGDMTNFVVQNYESSQPEAPFYLQKRFDYYTIDTHEKMANLPNQLKLGTKVKPNYVILVGNTDLEKRKIEMKAVFPTMVPEVNIEPSFVDNLAFLMNPSHNHNETFYIFYVRN
jgi:Alg9-like mannosyltransferase family